MRYRTLGGTGLQVSEVGFGGAPAGLRNYLGRWEPSSLEAARRVDEALERAVALGVSYFDTAPGYGDGLSEEMFGRALRPHRERVVIGTKVTGATADDIRRSAEQSLERLQTDRLDVLQYHGGWYGDEDARQMLRPDGAIAGMRALQDEGLVRFTGFTSEGVNGAVSRLIACGEFDVLQICYNLIFQHPYDPSRHAGIMFEAEEQRMGIVTMRPLTSGAFQKWLRSVYPDLVEEGELNRALLSFVLSNPLVDTAIVGMRSAEEVEANCALSDDTSLRIDLNDLHERYVQ